MSDASKGPKKDLWFRNKTYGYGWYPVTWQGWLAIVVYVVVISVVAYVFAWYIPDEVLFTWVYTPFVFVVTAVLIFVSYKKGEKPRWQWGKKK